MKILGSIGTALALVGPPRPIIIYHKPTERCDCRCRFCDFWKGQPDSDDVMDSGEVVDMIGRAGRAGFQFYALWGGEPLLVEPLGEWLGRARAANMSTTMCTAGYRLEERAAEIAPHLDQLLLSLEGVGEAHDRVRRVPGLFQRIEKGIEEYKRRGGSGVVIWTNLTRDNADQVRPVAEFAKQCGLAVEFFPAALYKGYNEEIVLDRDERKEIFSRVLELKRQGYPVMTSDYGISIMRDSRPFKCNLARLAVQVDSKGRAWACEPRVVPGLEPYGAIDDIDLGGLARSPDYLRCVERLSSCNACLLPCVAAMADNLIMGAMRRSFERFRN